MRPQLYCLADDYAKFCEVSLDWCCSESENAARKVADAIQILADDANRIVDMSSKSVEIVKMVTDKIKSILAVNKTVPISGLLDILEGINREHTEINNVIYPIIEALQFQDRLTQNLKNQAKMMRCWLDYREKVRRLGVFGEQQQLEFGGALAQCTTTPEERSILKSSIKGLHIVEKEPGDTGLF